MISLLSELPDDELWMTVPKWLVKIFIFLRFSPVWILWWTARFAFTLKALPHIPHSYGFSPVWTLWWAPHFSLLLFPVLLMVTVTAIYGLTCTVQYFLPRCHFFFKVTHGYIFYKRASRKWYLNLHCIREKYILNDVTKNSYSYRFKAEMRL